MKISPWLVQSFTLDACFLSRLLSNPYAWSIADKILFAPCNIEAFVLFHCKVGGMESKWSSCALAPTYYFQHICQVFQNATQERVTRLFCVHVTLKLTTCKEMKTYLMHELTICKMLLQFYTFVSQALKSISFHRLCKSSKVITGTYITQVLPEFTARVGTRCWTTCALYLRLQLK